MNRWVSSASGNAPASQALHTTPPAAPEKALRWSGSPAARARPKLRRESRGHEQLQPERELVGVRRVGRIGVQEGQLVAQQMKDRRMRVALREDPRDGVARARRHVE
ncbi:hypothetical protein LRS13_18180 [Svornostia abyssi]|uniref:Uncharacterized protein n=1 Tax=Svornostia abyssi TaxID=2898438 RepID=A0ABY5PDD1_9ACTN|nr:hypothetical protein LRS13_18180 [Parviterribacteraceae bacterium J379]